MSGMYEYVGTARTFWVPWLTARGWGTVAGWYGGGRQRVRRRREALRRVERMREDAKGSGGVQRSHLVVPTYLFNPGRRPACDPGRRDGTQRPVMRGRGLPPKPISTADSTDVRQPSRPILRLRRGTEFRYFAGRTRGKRAGNLQFLLLAGCRAAELWRHCNKKLSVSSEELARQLKTRTTKLGHGSTRCGMILADASNVLKDGGAPWCNAMRCDEMR